MFFDSIPEKLLSYKEFTATSSYGVPISNNFFCFFIQVPEVEGKNVYHTKSIFKKFQKSYPEFCRRITKVMTKAVKELESRKYAVKRHHRILYKAYCYMYGLLDENDLIEHYLPNDFQRKKLGIESRRVPRNVHLFA
ncbi:MAG: hypothetical protein G01um101433_587 [Parcubacteria group bacterium Gr01-1014_33]|nr:MAG: hypothetical protein G01um101433_587 [Parcubacteria group bacterium Gr01-1014_33]